MNKMHQAGDILNQKYKIIRVIGEGGTGITYNAIAMQTQQQVAIKNLSLRDLDNWKQIELFEREAKILATLDHPAIPKYLDYFCLDCDDSRNFYIVQQLAPGKSLFELVKDGWRTTEAEIKSIAEQILEILIYLHGLVPAVIHRDIKPQNLIRSDEGKIFLVDFGAVQNTYYTNFKQGSTVVGTYGFMAPEQFRGQAIAATDLYNLGATLVYLLTHHPPAELPHHNLKINFRDHVQISHQFATWLDKLIEPNIEHRFTSASLALNELRSNTFATRESFKKLLETKLNLIAIGLIAIASVASVATINVPRTDDNKIAELETNSSQLCSSLELAQYYINNGGDPDLIINYKNTESNLLFCLLATNINNEKHTMELIKTLNLLIDAGVDLEAINNQSQTPLLFWLSSQHRGYRNRNKNTVRLVTELLIDRGADINIRDVNNNTPLLLTMSPDIKDIKLAKKLIDRGADINVKNNSEITPLSLALENNYLEFSNFLLNEGADYNVVYSNGETLLFKAVEKGRRQIVKLLLNRGIDLNTRNNVNQTAIFKVFENRNYGEKQAILELLIAKGAKIDILDNYNRTLLSYVAGDKNVSHSTINLLLDKGLEVNTIDNEGYSPLSYAVNRSNWQAAKILIDNGADVDIKVALNELTPIFKAVIENNLEITKLLIDKKADLNRVNNQGNTILMHTFNRRKGINKEIFELLIANNLDINAQNNNGDTMLSLFIDSNNYYRNPRYKIETIDYLIAKGADVNVKDKKGRSILLKATYHNNQKVVDLLKKHGAKY